MKRLKVLVVDDDPGMRELVADILKTFRHSVVLAADFDPALDAIEHDTFDLLVTDHRMAQGVGSVLTSIAHQLRPALKVVGMSADEDFAFVQEQFLAAGAAGVIQKPFTITAFTALLASLFPESFPQRS